METTSLWTLRFTWDGTTTSIPCEIEKLLPKEPKEGEFPEYFKGLIGSGMKETQAKSSLIPDVHPNIAHLFVDYLHGTTLTEIPYTDLCALLSLADRLLFPKLKTEVTGLLVTCLNEATFSTLLNYLLSSDNLDPALLDAMRNLLEKRSIEVELDAEETAFLLNRLELSPIARALIMLNSRRCFDQLISLLPDVLSSADVRRDQVIELIARSNDVNLLSKAFLFSQKSLPKVTATNYPVITFEEFDINKVTSTAPVTRSIPNGGTYNQLHLLYDGRPDWVLALPDLSFNKVYYEAEHGRDKMALGLKTMGPENEDLMNRVFRPLERLYAELIVQNRNVLRVPLFRSADGGLLKPIFPEMRDHMTGEVIGGSRCTLHGKIRKRRNLFHEYPSSRIISFEELVELSKVEANKSRPFTLRQSHLDVTTLFVGNGIIAIQKELIYGYIELPNGVTLAKKNVVDSSSCGYIELPTDVTLAKK